MSEELAPDVLDHVIDEAQKTAHLNQEDFWLVTEPVGPMAPKIISSGIVFDEMMSKNKDMPLLACIGGEERVLDLVEEFKTDLNSRVQTIKAFFQAWRYQARTEKFVRGDVLVLSQAQGITGPEWYEEPAREGQIQSTSLMAKERIFAAQRLRGHLYRHTTRGKLYRSVSAHCRCNNTDKQVTTR